MTLKNYITGFILSALFTLASYGLVELHLSSSHEWPPHTFVIPAVIIFALAQFVVQAVYFLHLNTKVASRERIVMLGFAGAVVAILVGGSLWIMTNLNGRMMPTTEQMTQYMDMQQGI